MSYNLYRILRINGDISSGIPVPYLFHCIAVDKRNASKYKRHAWKYKRWYCTFSWQCVFTCCVIYCIFIHSREAYQWDNMQMWRVTRSIQCNSTHLVGLFKPCDGIYLRGHCPQSPRQIIRLVCITAYIIAYNIH